MLLFIKLMILDHCYLCKYVTITKTHSFVLSLVPLERLKARGLLVEKEYKCLIAIFEDAVFSLKKVLYLHIQLCIQLDLIR